MRTIPTHCPLCCKEISKRGPYWNKSPSCDDCGIFWCHDCERWRGWEKGADDNRWEACDNCAMPGRLPDPDPECEECSGAGFVNGPAGPQHCECNPFPASLMMPPSPIPLDFNVGTSWDQVKPFNGDDDGKQR